MHSVAIVCYSGKIGTPYHTLSFPTPTAYRTTFTAHSNIHIVEKKPRSKNNTQQQAQNQSRFTHDSIVDRRCYRAFHNKSEESDTIHNIIRHLKKFQRNRLIVADTLYNQSGHLDFHDFTQTLRIFHSR